MTRIDRALRLCAKRRSNGGSIMRIAIVVHHFHPHVGGLEMTAQLLAQGLSTRHGDDVLVITHTAGSGNDDQFPFTVLRSPERGTLLRAIAGADVVLHNNPCLQFWWPQLLARTPLVMAIRTHVTLPDQRLSPLERLKYHAKYALIQGADELATTSDHMAKHLTAPMTVIPNSYRDQIFTVSRPPETRERGSLIYFGRLTQDKGAAVAIEAVSRLRQRGQAVHLTVLGDGPEAPRLRQLAAERQVEDVVSFLGEADGPRANQVLNDHAIAIIPSLVPEAFGTVALEAAASGCVVVGSDFGGLPEAIGPCGPLFPPGDVDALVDRVETLIAEPALASGYREAALAHLQSHRENIMVDAYRSVLERAAVGRGRNVQARTLSNSFRRWLDPWPPSASSAANPSPNLQQESL